MSKFWLAFFSASALAFLLCDVIMPGISIYPTLGWLLSLFMSGWYLTACRDNPEHARNDE